MRAGPSRVFLFFAYRGDSREFGQTGCVFWEKMQLMGGKILGVLATLYRPIAGCREQSGERE